jgi:hypothetical protein
MGHCLSQHGREVKHQGMTFRFRSTLDSTDKSDNNVDNSQDLIVWQLSYYNSNQVPYYEVIGSFDVNTETWHPSSDDHSSQTIQHEGFIKKQGTAICREIKRNQVKCCTCSALL